jgi:hypothetical protein
MKPEEFQEWFITGVAALVIAVLLLLTIIGTLKWADVI